MSQNFLQDKLAANVTLEQGKTIPDAEGDVMRGLRKLLDSCHVYSFYLFPALLTNFYMIHVSMSQEN